MRRTAVILEEQPLLLDAIQGVLERANIAVVARATNPDNALALINEQRPDLFLTELVVAGDDAAPLAAIADALAQVPDLKVIVLSARSDPASVRRALMAGAVAYVLKTADADDLAVAVRQAFEQSAGTAPGDALALIAAGDAAEKPAASLTARELEILALAAEGQANARIARALWVTEQTVKFHLSNVYRKLGVANRTEAARWAQRHGLVEGARSSAHRS